MNNYEVIIIGGSFAGLSAALILGRSLKTVLVIDSNQPCFSPSAMTHGWITHDGNNPALLLESARADFATYKNISFLSDMAIDVQQSSDNFLVTTKARNQFCAKKIILATGVKETFPSIEGLQDCWGLSIFHCPYCQAFEVKDTMIGIIGNGDYGFDRVKLLSGWTKNLMLFTNGANSLTALQVQILDKHKISIVEKTIKKISHVDGMVDSVILNDDQEYRLNAIFLKIDFEHPGELPVKLGCKLSEGGYIIAEESGKTNITGVYAVGDCTTSFRTVATSTAAGLRAAIAVNNELMDECFN